MRKLAVCFCLLFLAPAFICTAYAQEADKTPETAKAPPAPEHFYRLNYVLEELDASGKPVNSRSFATTVSTAGSRSATISVGTKVPVATGSTDQGGKVETQFQYIDVGVKLGTRDIHEEGNGLSFTLHVEVSSLATPAVIEGVSEPVLRQNIWEGTALIPIGKPIVVSKSDDLDNKGSIQVEVTATPVQ